MHIIYERIAPEDPTSAPVIIRAVFSKVKPIPAAAQPEYELSIEITTGISAPPIGIINNIPTRKEIVTTVQKHWLIEFYIRKKLRQKYLYRVLNLKYVDQ